MCVWAEDLSMFNGIPWSAEIYIQAPETLGRFKGRLLSKPIVAEAWMNHRLSASRWIKSDFRELFNVLAVRRESDYVRRALPGALYDRSLRFPADFARLIELADALPQTGLTPTAMFATCSLPPITPADSS